MQNKAAIKNPKRQNNGTPDKSRRVLAAQIDAAIVILTFLLGHYILDKTGTYNPALRIAAIVVPLSYEPVLSATRCTVGQWFTGIRVRDNDTGARMNIFTAYLRFFYKAVLGWKSFLAYDELHPRTIHDNIAGTIVIMKADDRV